jgi:predicted dehydrogenase
MLSQAGLSAAQLHAASVEVLQAPSELALMQRLAEFPALVSQSALELSPHLVAFWLRDCAADFHGWYNAERVLVDDVALKHARLRLADATRQVIANGDLGEVELVVSNFCQANLGIPRLYTIGGGNPIIDMGIYPLAFSQQFLGNPSEIHAFGKLHHNDIDEETHTFMRFANGARSNFVLSARTSLPGWAGVSGPKGSISFGSPWFTPSSITIHGNGLTAAIETWTDESGLSEHLGLVHQVNAFAQYVDQGLLEAPIYTHKESIANIDTALKIGAQIGTRFK